MKAVELIFPSGAPAPPARSRWPRIAIITGAVAGLVVLGLFVSGRFCGTGDSADAVAVNRLMARRALAGFLAADTPEERAAFVSNGSRLLPLMRTYYAGRESDVFLPDAFQPVGTDFAASDADLVAFELPRLRSLPALLACFRKSDDGTWLMDWEIWRQSGDGGFRDFIVRPAEGEHTLRVRLTSGASGGEGTEMTVSDAFGGTETISFNIRRSDLAALYARDLPAGKSRTATVQLVWLNDGLTGTLRPALRRHVCWGFEGLDGIEPAPVDLPSHAPLRPRRPTTEPDALAAVTDASAAIQGAVKPTGTGTFTAITRNPVSGGETAGK